MPTILFSGEFMETNIHLSSSEFVKNMLSMTSESVTILWRKRKITIWGTSAISL